MILGILSDSHGRAERTVRALTLLDEKGAAAFVHCGDIGGEDVLIALSGRTVWFVWGNCDYPDASMNRYVRSLGLPLPDATPLRIDLDGSRIAVFHGHEREIDRFDSTQVDYVLHGHTHVPRDERIGQTRFINPGALHRAAEHTVATLDLSSDSLSFHALE
ncbi:MAG: metallophosphoesterase family protein [Phycisphaerae bacterium]